MVTTEYHVTQTMLELSAFKISLSEATAYPCPLTPLASSHLTRVYGILPTLRAIKR